LAISLSYITRIPTRPIRSTFHIRCTVGEQRDDALLLALSLALSHPRNLSSRSLSLSQEHLSPQADVEALDEEARPEPTPEAETVEWVERDPTPTAAEDTALSPVEGRSTPAAAGAEVSFVGDAHIALGDATSSLGDAKSSLGDAKSSLGDATSLLGDAKSFLGDAKSFLGDATSLLGDAKSFLGDAKSSLGDAESSLGDA
jgi:hypothetical protein